MIRTLSFHPIINIHKFTGYVTAIDGYGGSSLKVKQVSLCTQIGQLPPSSSQAFILPLPEYLSDINILVQLDRISTTIGEF